MLKARWTRLILCVLMTALPAVEVAAGTGHEWRFRVLLDGREIGYHNFLLEQDGEVQKLTSEAAFEVRLLFVKLFEYQHHNQEIWRDNCLAGIESYTDANGETYRVSGRLQGDRFVVQGMQGAAALPNCVMSFAYWNPRFLVQEWLLNSQNGAYVAVDVDEPELVEFAGTDGPARRYLVRAGEMDLLLWYSLQDEWLGLETETEGGRRLRYERLPDDQGQS